MKVGSFSQGAYEKVKTQVSLDPKLELITTHSSIPHAGPASWAWDLPCAEGTQALLVLCCGHLHILSNSDQRAPRSLLHWALQILVLVPPVFSVERMSSWQRKAN